MYVELFNIVKNIELINDYVFGFDSCLSSFVNFIKNSLNTQFTDRYLNTLKSQLSLYLPLD